jgi:hypothetical protein
VEREGEGVYGGEVATHVWNGRGLYGGEVPTYVRKGRVSMG